jgi:hypothetical protein
MGLLDATPDDWLDLYRRAAQNRSPNDGSAAATNVTPPSWLPRSQRAPLSLAGPDLAANEPWPSAPVAPEVMVPQAGQSPALPSWAQVPSGNPFAESPRPAEQNLTVRALRMKGVPEADIAAAGGNPELMKQLIHQNFAPGSAAAQSASPSAAAAPIGDDRASTIAALRGIPLAGAYVDKGAALLNAAAQPWLETGLSHAGTFAQREAENENTIKVATDQYEKDHPIGTRIGKFAVGAGALAPFGATALGARAFGIAGEALLPSILKGATTFGLLNAGDTALHGGDAKDIARSALFGTAGGVALPLAGKAVQAVAPFLTPISNNTRGRISGGSLAKVVLAGLIGSGLLTLGGNICRRRRWRLLVLGRLRRTAMREVEDRRIIDAAHLRQFSLAVRR